jgi:hypothetical protein
MADELTRMEGLTMAKSETAVTAPVTITERLPVKTSQIQVDRRDHVTKRVIINMTDELSFADLMDDPKLLRLAQKDRSKAINALDEILLVWHDKVVFTHCDFASDSEVILFKAPTLARRDRDREPYNDGQYAVRAHQGKWAAFRISDNVRMGALYDRFEPARNEIWNLTGRVA